MAGDTSIGTTTGGYKLNVNGTIFSSKVTNNAAISNSPSNASLLLYAPTTTNYYGGIIGWAEGNLAASISAYDDGSGGALGLSISTGNATSISERMRITSGGNLLVGTTSDTGQMLQVNGNSFTNGTTLSNDFLSASGSVSNPFGSWTTMFTIPTGQISMYQLIAVSSGNGLTYTASALVVVNSAGVELRNYVPGGALFLQASGYNIQCQNGSGSTLSISYKYIKIG
jgi:hypothetical protein